MHRAHRSAQAEVERGEDRQDWLELSNAFEYDTSCGLSDGDIEDLAAYYSGIK